MASLQCLPPTVQPRVSDHMNQIIDMIKKVTLQLSYTYVADMIIDIDLVM